MGLTDEEMQQVKVHPQLGYQMISRIGFLKGSGDVIVGIGGQPIKGQADFYTRMWKIGEAGVDIPLDVLRGEAGMSADKAVDILQINGFDDIATAYRTWVRSQQSEE